MFFISSSGSKGSWKFRLFCWSSYFLYGSLSKYKLDSTGGYPPRSGSAFDASPTFTYWLTGASVLKPRVALETVLNICAYFSSLELFLLVGLRRLLLTARRLKKLVPKSHLYPTEPPMPPRRSFAESKEDQNFHEGLRLFEEKKYKKALKLMDANLKKKLAHAELLALKGLLLYNIQKEAGEEMDPAYSEIRLYFSRAIKENPSHPVIHHIVAIFERSINNYKGAAENYTKALNCGLKNMNIWKDLSVANAQLRLYPALVASRAKSLEYFLAYRANWTGLAVAHDLAKNYELAEKTLSRFELIAEGKLSESDFVEHLECVLYKNRIIFQSGDVARALKHLQDSEEVILDKLAFGELKALYHTLLGDHKSALIEYRKLLKRNPDKIDYYFLLENALQIDPKDTATRVKLYTKLGRFYPKADPPKTIPLMFLSPGDQFELFLSDYLLGKLKKGVPSIFKNIVFLYTNPAKVQFIEKCVLEFLDSLQTSAKVEDPTVVVWTLYFLAQHYMKTGSPEKAEAYIDQAIAHSPTLVELSMYKAYIVKHRGDLNLAATIMDGARKLDLQDRFVNCKTTKYYLRAGEFQKALDTALLFCKTEPGENGLKDLHMMQANWYLIEEADAYLKLYMKAARDAPAYLELLDSSPDGIKAARDKLEELEKLKGLAVKRYHGILDNYSEFKTDQVDFHGYCLRKGTPRAYLDMLKWADNLGNQPLYLRVLKGISEAVFNEDASIKQYADGLVGKKGRSKTKGAKKKENEELERLKSTENDKDVYGEALLKQYGESPADKLSKLAENTTDKQLLLYVKIMFFVYVKQAKFLLAFQLLKTCSVLKGKPLLAYFLEYLKKAYSIVEDKKLAMMRDLVFKQMATTFEGFLADKLGSENYEALVSSDRDRSLEDLFYTLKVEEREAVRKTLNEKIKRGLVDKWFDPYDLVIVETLTSLDNYFV